MKKYIELTECDSDGRIVIFVDSIQGLYRVHDYEYNKEFTEVMVSGYTFIVNEPIDEILERMESEDKDADKKCTYKETGCGSCKRQLDCPIEADTAESENRCKNCEYYLNPDYTRCHECKAESEDKE